MGGPEFVSMTITSTNRHMNVRIHPRKINKHTNTFRKTPIELKNVSQTFKYDVPPGYNVRIRDDTIPRRIVLSKNVLNQVVPVLALLDLDLIRFEFNAPVST